MYPGPYVYSLPGELSPQNLHLGSHVDSLQGDLIPYAQHLGSNVHTLQGKTLPDLAPGVIHPQSPL